MTRAQPLKPGSSTQNMDEVEAREGFSSTPLIPKIFSLPEAGWLGFALLALIPPFGLIVNDPDIPDAPVVRATA